MSKSENASHGNSSRESHELVDCEWAIAHILSYTTPRDACRLALVSKTFRAASDSDLVWERMLPNNHRHKAEQADDGQLLFPSKKELYYRLCRSISICNGTQRYWLDRLSGGECYMLSAAALTIAWGGDSRYWQWIPSGGSWFKVVANLETVCWFELRGGFHQILQPGTYTLSFRVRLAQVNSRSENKMQAHGWVHVPIKLSLSTSDGQIEESMVYLDDSLPANYLPGLPASECWWECEVGSFNVEDSESPIEVNFSMKEIDVLNWKGGLFLDGAILRPSKVDLSINETFLE